VLLVALSTVAALALAGGIAARRRAASEPELDVAPPAAEVAASERAGAEAPPDAPPAGPSAQALAVEPAAAPSPPPGATPPDAVPAPPRDSVPVPPKVAVHAPPAAPRVADPYLEAMEAGAHKYRAQAFSAAATEYRRAARIRETGEALAALGRALYDDGQTAEAGIELRRAVQVDPASAPAWLALGEVHLERGEAAEARAAYERYLEIEPRGRWARDVRQVLERLGAR
jgi:tetratricopeptide (TPR) repeat protein